ncbi:unnamed protein product [Rhizophagus irregularis]|nr:unnamed protein product [Rhizophagus irregularis]
MCQRTNPDKMKSLYQYAIKRGEKNPEKFSIITGAEINKWDNECFHNVLEKDMRFYRGAVERSEDPRKHYKFLIDRDMLISEELLHRSILKSRLNTAWLDNLMKEWEKTLTQFIQIFAQV